MEISMNNFNEKKNASKHNIFLKFCLLEICQRLSTNKTILSIIIAYKLILDGFLYVGNTMVKLHYGRIFRVNYPRVLSVNTLGVVWILCLEIYLQIIHQRPHILKKGIKFMSDGIRLFPTNGTNLLID